MNVKRLVHNVTAGLERSSEATPEELIKAVSNATGKGITQDSLDKAIQLVAQNMGVPISDVKNALGPHPWEMMNKVKYAQGDPGVDKKYPISVVLIGNVDPGNTADAYFYDGDEDKQYPFKSMPAPSMTSGEDEWKYLARTGLQAFFEKAETAASAYCRSKGWKYDGLDPIETYPSFA